jgi:hypothetical protein
VEQKCQGVRGSDFPDGKRDARPCEGSPKAMIHWNVPPFRMIGKRYDAGIRCGSATSANSLIDMPTPCHTLRFANLFNSITSGAIDAAMPRDRVPDIQTSVIGHVGVFTSG